MKNILAFLCCFLLIAPLHAQPFSGQKVATGLLLFMATLVLILMTLKIIKRMKQPSINTKSTIKLVTQMALGQKERILLLEINQEQLLVGVTANQINLIKKLDSTTQSENLAEIANIKKIIAEHKTEQSTENIF